MQKEDKYKQFVKDLALMIEGEEEVEKMDSLLSLAITGGDYNWL